MEVLEIGLASNVVLAELPRYPSPKNSKACSMIKHLVSDSRRSSCAA